VTRREGERTSLLATYHEEKGPLPLGRKEKTGSSRMAFREKSHNRRKAKKNKHPLNRGNVHISLNKNWEGGGWDNRSTPGHGRWEKGVSEPLLDRGRGRKIGMA